MATITRNFDRPVTTRKRLGGVPRDRYESTWWPKHGLGKVERRAGAEGGPVDVYRDVPEYDEHGQPQLENVTETITEEPYQPGRRGVACSLLGAVTAGLGAATLLAAGPLGIVVAAGLGAYAGQKVGEHTAKDDQVDEVWVDRKIVHPHMEGHTEYTIPVPEFRRRYDRDGERHTDVSIRGYYHHHSPDIREEEVGEFTEPTLQHSRKVTPGAAALLTAGAGLALGVAVAALDRSGKRA
ncbi:MAG: hypothetical protein AB7S38_24445 [Vulcanimicrobiota bacterium]